MDPEEIFSPEDNDVDFYGHDWDFDEDFIFDGDFVEPDPDQEPDVYERSARGFFM
jgi:hypothetical protein